MKKTIILVSVITIILGIFPVTSFSEEEAIKHEHCYCGGYIEIGDHTSHSVKKFTAWNGRSKIIYDGNNTAYVYLTKDIVRDTALTVPGRKTLTICLNGHSVSVKGQDRVININTGGKLNLCDCTRSADACIRDGYKEYGAGVHNNGTFAMYGGVITKNTGGYGGGIYNNGNIYLYGGDIYDNKASYGGGVWNDNDSTKEFVMYEGTIMLNTASCGGGIWNNDNAVLTLKGGNILQNASGVGGGGIWNNGSAIEIDGGMILENASKHGGGIWNNGGTLLIKSGNISKNIATTNPQENPNGYGGGIWDNGEGVVNMTGGEITFNKAFSGGGVWCNDGSRFVMSGGVIAENEAEKGAGVYIQRSIDTVTPGKFRLTGDAGIVLNYSYGAGGGVYIKGILDMDGNGEIIGNLCIDEKYNDIYKEDSAEINENASMPTQFIDVSADAYYLEPLKWAIEKGITTGTSDVTFSPDEYCTRGQVVTFLYRLHGSPETDGFYFADTNSSDYFYDATRWAWELKMERTNTFSPNYPCTREAAIRYMWIAAGSPQVTTTLPFTDISEDAKYAMAVAWALENGITTGTSDTTFSPNEYCTRAQIVTFLYRAFN